MKMKFRFLGGAEGIGRMGMTMEGGGKTLLIEYGMSPSKPPEYPLQAPRTDTFLTTATWTCGMLPPYAEGTAVRYSPRPVGRSK